jgi:hypothetical protein
MEHASLVAFLNGVSQPQAFAREIAAEVEACNSALAFGGVGSIIVTDGPSMVVTRESARRLLKAVADGSLSFEAANYVADALIMSDEFDFEDATVNDAIYFLGDDSRPPTSEEVRAALSHLAMIVG